MSWTSNLVLEFIDIYRRERMLWDPKHSQYKNRRDISMAWLRIQSCFSLNLSVDELKKKKESLMTSFRLHWNRKKKIPHYRITWFAYSAMESFLSEVYERDSTNELETEFFNETDKYGNSPIKSDAVDPISCRSTKSPDSCTAKRKSNCLITSSNKHTYRQLDGSKVHCKDSNIDHNSEDQDEYDLYGQLLAKKLRKLDERQRDVAMHEIDIIMFRAKMQGLPSQTLNQTKSKSPIPRKLKSPIFIVTHQNAQYEDENISYEEHMQPETSA